MIIEVYDLYKKYGSKTVVSNVSLALDKGEILGFIGPNGAGKSTTIKMIAGVLPVYKGQIRIDGVDITSDPRRAKKLIGYLPENAPLPPNMSVEEFLKYAATMHGMGFHARKKAVQKAVERCALQSVLGEEIETLSKGFKRRVCLAQAIIHEPPVLLLDEPTDGLDPNQKREIRNLIQQLRQNTAIIISTHILEEIRSICSRVILLADGKLMYNGTADDFRKIALRTPCISFRIKPEMLNESIRFMREDFPGSGRFDGENFVIPANHPDLAEIEKTLEPMAEQKCEVEATPDDVFASLTQECFGLLPLPRHSRTLGMPLMPEMEDDDD